MRQALVCWLAQMGASGGAGEGRRRRQRRRAGRRRWDGRGPAGHRRSAPAHGRPGLRMSAAGTTGGAPPSLTPAHEPGRFTGPCSFLQLLNVNRHGSQNVNGLRYGITLNKLQDLEQQENEFNAVGSYMPADCETRTVVAMLMCSANVFGNLLGWGWKQPCSCGSMHACSNHLG